ncbi:fumarylacetoacetate hydrolase family protein [Evansella halocellulosilytica]|uniref:fumarylacetoacetate hydrolase family protein n=1 Tax=Evansella halocellulosilytica TaxID=2011013 RepID=UPI000BB8277D|nr:fumarylacetoacetate hydrolase family protein [Evansella halocellulosilytica]
MRIIRYKDEHSNTILAAYTEEGEIYNLPFTSLLDIVHRAEECNCPPASLIEEIITSSFPLSEKLHDLELLTPIEAPEVWAAGVTYQKSMEARNYEATGGKLNAKTFYDKVYDAKRPEIFFKSTKERTVGPNQDVCLRSDSTWQIPEPELGLVIGNEGKIIGYTIGNDMSCRDIEGENPLYLPQAKIWKQSCSIGPAVRLAETVPNPYDLTITCRIYRDGSCVFEGDANTGQLKRTYDELVTYLTLDNTVFEGTVLLTGTCIVPPNDFSLQEDDQIEIEIDGIGVLINIVKKVVQISDISMS